MDIRYDKELDVIFIEDRVFVPHEQEKEWIDQLVESTKENIKLEEENKSLKKENRRLQRLDRRRQRQWHLDKGLEIPEHLK